MSKKGENLKKRTIERELGVKVLEEGEMRGGLFAFEGDSRTAKKLDFDEEKYGFKKSKDLVVLKSK